MITKLGTFYTLDELTVSQTAARRGLLNTPPKEAMDNLLLLVQHTLDPLRRAVGKPIVVTSGYRSPEINRLIGGAPTSDHVNGRAADIHQPEMTVRQLMRVVLENNFPFDQMIDEFGGRWLHISYRHEANRRQILQALHRDGRTWYAHLEPNEV